AQATVTPANWKPVLTPTAGPPTKGPGPMMTAQTRPTVPPQLRPPVAPAFTPTGGPAGALPATPRQGGPPFVAQTATPAVRPPPFLTPTPDPPAKCRFSDGVELSVPVLGAVSGVITPGAVQARYQGTPGWITVAHGEPQPGLVLELRLPATMFVAGAVISPEVRVRNGTTTDVGVFTGVGTYGDDQQPINTTDSRS